MQFYFTVLSALLFSTSIMAQGVREGCQASCPGGGNVVVDLKARCMKLSSGKTIPIDIGKDGPNMTVGGQGKLHKADGAKYQTKPYATRGYDNDAIATGIQGNDAVGKWIHKTRGCQASGRQVTKGCIAISCKDWPEVKKELTGSGPGNGEAGNTITICGSTNDGKGIDATGKNGGRGSGETGDEDYDDYDKKNKGGGEAIREGR